MHRSKKIVIVCHCLLNANAKVYPLAQCGGVYSEVLAGSIAGRRRHCPTSLPGNHLSWHETMGDDPGAV